MIQDIPEGLVFLTSIDGQENTYQEGSDLVIRVPELAKHVDMDSGTDLQVAVLEETGGTNRNGYESNGARQEDTETPPVKEQQQYEQVEVVDVGGKGDGVIKIDGFVVFIPDGNEFLGERVNIQITDVNETYADAKVVSAAGSY